MASSVARPPALRITWASPSARPAYFAGSRRASMQVRIANPRAGGSAKSFLAPNPDAYFLVGCDNFINNLGHGPLSLVVRQCAKSTLAGFAFEFQSLPICSELHPASSA